MHHPRRWLAQETCRGAWSGHPLVERRTMARDGALRGAVAQEVMIQPKRLFLGSQREEAEATTNVQITHI